MSQNSPNEWQLTTPVVLIIFNRPDTTAQVFAEIAKARPLKLLIVADGPRKGRSGEAEKCKATREVVNHVNWPCEVLTEYSDVNLGCKRRVSSGLDWAFAKVQEAIVLEDDCLPDSSFFYFCDEMLDRYRNDQRVGMITGNNFNFGRRRNDESYYFSKHVFIWGWATWGDRWRESFDVDMKDWIPLRDRGWLFDFLRWRDEAKFWTRTFDIAAENTVDSWASRWVFANWKESRFSIVPSQNLISNIGFGPTATHTQDDGPLSNLPTQSLEFPLVHPKYVVPESNLDRENFRLLFHRSLLTKVIDKLHTLLKQNSVWAQFWDRGRGKGKSK